MQEGTSLDDPLLNAIQLLRRSSAKQKTIFIFSDFIFYSSGMYNALWLAQIAASLDIQIVTVVVGTNGKCLGPVALKPEGGYVFGNIDSETDFLLAEKIALLSGGVFLKTSKDIVPEIKVLDKKSTKGENQKIIKPYLIDALLRY